MLKLFRFGFLIRLHIKNQNHNTKLISCFFHRKNINSNFTEINKTKSLINRKMLVNSVKGFENVAREWDDTFLGKKYRTDHKKYPGCPFIVMTYNILAQTYIGYHPGLYRGTNPDFLKWEFRLDNILRELRNRQPHILCLQEVQDSHYQALKDGLNSLEYKALFCKRTGQKSDGCAIFVSKRMFHIRGHRNLKLYSDCEPLLGRDNIAMLLKLSLISNPDSSFVVANTHLLYNPKRDDIRLAQLQRILTALKEFISWSDGQKLPVMFMGDFNFPPSSPLFDFVTKGEILWDGGITSLCREELKTLSISAKDHTDIKHPFRKSSPPDKLQLITHSMKLQSVLSREQLKDCATTYHRRWITVDHIFYTEEADSKLKLLSTLLPPPITDCFPIPNAVFGSDHHSVAANFLLC